MRSATSGAAGARARGSTRCGVVGKRTTEQTKSLQTRETYVLANHRLAMVEQTVESVQRAHFNDSLGIGWRGNVKIGAWLSAVAPRHRKTRHGASRHRRHRQLSLTSVWSAVPDTMQLKVRMAGRMAVCSDDACRSMRFTSCEAKCSRM